MLMMMTNSFERTHTFASSRLGRPSSRTHQLVTARRAAADRWLPVMMCLPAAAVAILMGGAMVRRPIDRSAEYTEIAELKRTADRWEAPSPEDSLPLWLEYSAGDLMTAYESAQVELSAFETNRLGLEPDPRFPQRYPVPGGNWLMEPIASSTVNRSRAWLSQLRAAMQRTPDGFSFGQDWWQLPRSTMALLDVHLQHAVHRDDRDAAMHAITTMEALIDRDAMLVIRNYHHTLANDIAASMQMTSWTDQDLKKLAGMIERLRFDEPEVVGRLYTGWAQRQADWIYRQTGLTSVDDRPILIWDDPADRARTLQWINAGLSFELHTQTDLKRIDALMNCYDRQSLRRRVSPTAVPLAHPELTHESFLWGLHSVVRQSGGPADDAAWRRSAVAIRDHIRRSGRSPRSLSAAVESWNETHPDRRIDAAALLGAAGIIYDPGPGDAAGSDDVAAELRIELPETTKRIPDAITLDERYHRLRFPITR